MSLKLKPRTRKMKNSGGETKGIKGGSSRHKHDWTRKGFGKGECLGQERKMLTWGKNY
jgi:hypothetical protein